MSLELLPNEILLDIFNYFNGVELLRTFYGLNFRLNFLLHDRFLNCSFKFNSVSKRDFDTICQQYLPTMAAYMITLDLTDDEETPTQIKLFLSYSPSFEQFTQLRSLSLFNLRSYSILMKIVEECHHLCNLTHLGLFNCYQDCQVDFQLMVNQIWSLSKLSHCTIGIGFTGLCVFPTPTKTSLSLEYVSIERVQVKLDQIDRLLEYTPALKCLSISVLSFVDNNYIPSPLLTLIDLNISSSFTCNASNMGIFLQNTPNLHRLNVDLSSEIVDGNQWEEIIRNHLPNLQIFQLKMKVTLPLRQNLQQRVDDLINSFQTSFWIDEHQWFVRCLTWNRTIYLYTLSNCYEENLPISYKSTCPEDDHQDFYNSISKIISPTFFDQPIPSYIRLSKINCLYINLPINDQLWSIVSNFNRLESLKILFHNNSFQSQVQALLDRAPHLIRLSISQHESTPLQTSLFKYRNVSIRELDLRNINHYFNEEECITLSHSPLGVQCEKLSILIHNRQSIISLVENMLKIRALNVRCKDEKYIEQSTSNKDNDAEYSDYNKNSNDDYIQWLKDHLPPACTIVRDPKLTCNILIWI
ncbi:unnamed protein product [Rotaria sp. Silwood2]|nr:unnamed protein product [Rotaria sp. Silwood2]CAF2806327.1 unnamed protein product [Rotaria sp. Silwood2]CAF3076183.1 unnamed protein product [Rotaria sp. Silwood2]CAF3216432.1 unnamed protein product [Rotaria sp. Silwood2]CAF4037318.1 unnamed protein product [Rotaria sp. Silwood2]